MELGAVSGGFHTITLGCKLNQFDSAALEAELVRRGLRPEPDADRAAVVIVNTCTVTGKADAEARRLIRRVRRRNPVCRLLVTGCFAEREPDRIGALEGVDRVFGNREKTNLRGILDELGVGEQRPQPLAGNVARLPGWSRAAGDRGCDWPLNVPEAVHFGDRSRAFLKVQEGCDLACSYCVIPQVRGPSRSVPPERLEGSLLALLRAGYREVVLTGVNTGSWGRDLVPRDRLAVLVRRLLQRCGPNRLRLNSLEPLNVTDEIVDLMAADPRLAPHLQVPLQSGSAALLRAMRRNYRVSDYLDRLERVRRRVPAAGLGADVIVGFPGETDRRFEKTYRLIESSPLNYLHVFSWSPRPGTPASEMDGRVPASAARERSARLRELGARLGFRFRLGLEGRRLDAVVLGKQPADGRARALTGNFVEVSLESAEVRPGDLVSVRVTVATPARTHAVLSGTPVWARSDPVS